MKKIIIVMLFLAISTIAEGATTELGWQADQEAVWADLQANNHAIYQDVDDFSDYQNNGVREAIMYQLTGNGDYCDSSFNYNDNFRGRTLNTSGDVPGGDTVRDRFVEMAIMYSWCADELTSSRKALYKDILNFWTDLVLRDQTAINTYNSSLWTGGGVNAQYWGIVTWDTDNLVGFYFGATIFALALSTDDPTRSEYILNYQGTINPYSSTTFKWGNPATDTGQDNSIRNVIRNYMGGASGGEWMESTLYNLGTIQYIVQAVDAINGYYGEDKFPDITSLYDDFADILTEQMLPGFYHSYMWGDNNDTYAYNPYYYRRVPIMGTLAFLTNDATDKWAWKQVYDGNAGTNLPGRYLFLVPNPYDTQTAKSGQTSKHATGRGTSYWHEDWTSNGSYFASSMFNKPGADHQNNLLADFMLWRNGNWAINHPVGYYGYYSGQNNESYYANTFIANAGTPFYKQEAKGEVEYDTGSNFVYHVGAAGGWTGTGATPWPEESLHEWTRQQLFIHHDDDSDSIVLFDRVNSDDPRYLNNYSYMRSEVKTYIDQYQAKHMIIFHMPVDPTKSGDSWTWTAPNGETVKLTTFVDSYDSVETDIGANWSSTYGSNTGPWSGGFATPSKSRLLWQLRIQPTSNTGFDTYLNVLHVGSTATLTELTSVASSQEDADGVKITTGTQDSYIMFKSTEGTPPTPTYDQGLGYVHDSGKLDDIAELHRFQNRFEFQVTIHATNTSDFFICGLDPELTWTGKYSTDGLTFTNITGFTSPTDGIATFEFVDVSDDVVNFKFESSGAALQTCANTPALCSTEGACELGTGIDNFSGWCAVAQDCWCDRNGDSLNDCATTACDDTCADDCSLCVNQTECEASAATDCDSTGYCCWHDSQSTTPNSCKTTAQAEPVEFEKINDADCMVAWIFDETSGTTVEDYCASGTDHDATVEAITAQEATYDTFEADNSDWMSVADHNDLDFTDSESFTVCVKFNPETIKDQDFIYKGRWGTGVASWGLGMLTNDYQFFVRDTSNLYQALYQDHDQTAGTMQYLCGVKNETDSTLKLYHGNNINDMALVATDDITSLGDISNENDLWISGRTSASGEITLDNAAQVVSTGSDGSNPLSGSFTVGSYDNRVLVVAVVLELVNGVSGDLTPNSVTYGGQAMTQTGTPRTFQYSTCSISLWYLLAPPTGSNTLSVTVDANTRGKVGAISLYNVKQQAPEATASAASSTTTITTVTNDAVIVGAGGDVNASTDLTAGSGQTERYTDGGTGQVSNEGYTEKITTAGAETFTVTNADAVIVASFEAGAIGGGSSPSENLIDGDVYEAFIFDRALSLANLQTWRSEGIYVAEVSCDSNNLGLCTTEGDCTTAGGYWYNSYCNQNDQVALCDESNWEPCDQDDCNLYWYWYNGQCNQTEQPEANASLTLYPTADVYIDEANADSNYDTGGIKVVDGTTDYVGLIKYNLSLIPTGSIISTATLKFTLSNTQDFDKVIYVYKCLRDWVEGQATWNIYSTGNSWGTAGAKSDNNDLNGIIGTATEALAYIDQTSEVAGTQIQFRSNQALIDEIQDSIGGTLNLVLHQQSGDSSEVNYYDSENSVVGLRPQLYVTYLTPSGDGEEVKVIFTGTVILKGFSIVE